MYKRKAEQFACRLAAEKNLPVRVVRMDGNAETEALRRLPLQAMRVLMLGASGEIYNISGKKDEPAAEKPKTSVDGKKPIRIGDPKIVSFQDVYKRQAVFCSLHSPEAFFPVSVVRSSRHCFGKF